MSKCLLIIFIFTFFLLSFSSLAQGSSIAKRIWGNDRQAKTLFVEEQYDFRSAWLKIGKTDKERVEKLLEILTKTSTGDRIVMNARIKALDYGSTLEELISIGDGSLTDTTLIRRYFPSQGDKVSYESRSQVIINRSHHLQDAILDLAHELTHFSFRSAFNPYVVNFNLKDFIKSTIEGQGGEVDAYLVECKVLKEAFSESTWRGSQCSRMVNDQGKLSRNMIVEKFYQVGHHYKVLKKELETHNLKLADLPQITDGDATYISSAYGVPYPLAALREYTGIMEKSCLNDYKRLVLMRESNSGRRPASQAEIPKTDPMTKAFKERCTEYMGERAPASF